MKIFKVLAAVVLWGAGAAPMIHASGDERTVSVRHETAASREVALVFAPITGDEAVPEILDVLRRFGATGTFFLTGRWVDKHPALAEMIAREGHEVGNGSWSRKDLRRMADWEVEREVLLADDRYAARFGPSYVPLFRAPSGVLDGRVRDIVEDLGLTPVRCAIRCEWRGEGTSPPNVAERLLHYSDAALDGATILVPANISPRDIGLSAALQALRRRGFDFVALSAWLEPRPKPLRPVLSTAD